MKKRLFLILLSANACLHMPITELGANMDVVQLDISAIDEIELDDEQLLGLYAVSRYRPRHVKPQSSRTRLSNGAIVSCSVDGDYLTVGYAFLKGTPLPEVGERFSCSIDGWSIPIVITSSR